MKKLIAIAVSLATVITMFAGCGKEEVFRIIKVNSFEGVVTVEREEKTDVFEGMQLISDDSVEIGEASLLELLADSDKHIVAEENTAFKLRSTGTETSGNVTIDLLYGKSLFTIDNKLPDDSTFEVNTPNASLSVRGTSFWVEYIIEERKTIVEVIEGIVLVTYNGGEELIEKGRTIIIKEVDGEIQIEISAGEADIEAVVTTTADVSATTPTETTTVSETTAEETTTTEGTTAETTVSEEITTTATTTAETTEAVTTAASTVTTTTTAATTTKANTTKATTTKAKTTTAAETSEAEQNSSIMSWDNYLLMLTRNYQLTGDDSYGSLEAESWGLLVPNANISADLGIPVEYANYYEMPYMPDNSYLSGTLKELKPYIESHIDEVNEFFEKNKNEAVKRYKEGRDDWCITVPVEWFPDKITMKNETGTYVLNILQTSMNIAMSHSHDGDDVDNYISDYFVGVVEIGTNGETTWNHACSVNFTFYGTVEKIS